MMMMMMMMLIPGAGVALASGVWLGNWDGIVDTDARTGCIISPCNFAACGIAFSLAQRPLLAFFGFGRIIIT
jgi:hypothetical protein